MTKPDSVNNCSDMLCNGCNFHVSEIHGCSNPDNPKKPHCNKSCELRIKNKHPQFSISVAAQIAERGVKRSKNNVEVITRHFDKWEG